MGKTVGRLLISVRSLPLCDNLAALINELSMVLSMSCSPVYLGWSAVMHNGHIRGKPVPALNKLLISGCEISASLGIDDRTVRLEGLSPGKPSNTKGYDRRGTVGVEKF